ncbi:YlxM family DNA-binding protein [Sinanaerobacter sp. ZZT-01]|uniref:YlxM family DNA-binding protein n=1 Tax=Sinanaerobacter sp. ZZT-01 TaxID=3111540 RepID=UPI002D7808CD|nr:YlxM family DNA-binding protein [Sinanaerobacter sp. ZZT-01]WRR92818.1 YlxM family DNA-binding protein [Sinanaerobacter sp. ZZT-01]
MFDKIIEVSMLYDFYGQLLSEKQRTYFELYHEDNYSLSEIGQEYNISRQGVYDVVKKAEKALYNFEKKLGLVQKFLDTQNALHQIDQVIEALIFENSKNTKLVCNLTQIRSTIGKLND